MALSDQDREFVDHVAELAAQKAVEAAIPRMRSVASEEVLIHSAACPGSKIHTIWVTLVALGSLLVGIAGIIGLVITVRNGH